MKLLEDRRPQLCCLASTVFGLFVLAGCESNTIEKDLTTAEMRGDLEYLAEEFPQRERSFTSATLEEFRERLAVVTSKAGALSHNQFLMGIQWTVAATDNGHTEALTHEQQRLRLPLDLHWFDDGLYVIAVRPGYEDLLGAHVISIEGASPDELLAALDAYSPGTDEHARILSGYFLERPELLAAIGKAEASDALTIIFDLPGHPSVKRTIPALRSESTSRATDSRHLLDDKNPLPLYLREPDKAAFMAWLPESDAAYIRINRNDDKALSRTLDQFLVEIGKQTPRNVIVDLRLNGGGNYELTAPFAEALPDRIPKDGRLVLILGNETFSAAIATAAILKARAGKRALIVGDRAGDDLQFWSEGGFLVLPNSGLRIHYSDGYHDWRNGYDESDPRYRPNSRNAEVNERFSVAAGSLKPDVRTPLTFANYISGRDPVMATIRSLLESAD